MLVLMFIPCAAHLQAFPMGVIPLASYNTTETTEWINEFIACAKEHHIFVRGFSADNTTVHREIITNMLLPEQESLSMECCLFQYKCHVPLPNQAIACADIRHLHRKLINSITSMKKIIIIGKLVVNAQEYTFYYNTNCIDCQICMSMTLHMHNCTFHPTQNHSKAIFYNTEFGCNNRISNIRSLHTFSVCCEISILFFITTGLCKTVLFTSMQN